MTKQQKKKWKGHLESSSSFFSLWVFKQGLLDVEGGDLSNSMVLSEPQFHCFWNEDSDLYIAYSVGLL